VSYVTETAEDAVKKAIEIATVIAGKSPIGINASKKSILYSRDHTVQDGLDHINLMNSAMLLTKDMETAVTSAMSKSKAEYPKL
jgi:delta(3,5)-delta(2,4)-dienoyl-CoA isomerase